MTETPKLHREIASSAFPKGAHLKCWNPACDRGERITSADCADYLAHGWPMHCGQTMHLVTESAALPRDPEPTDG